MKKIIIKNHHSFYLFTFSVVIFFTLPFLLQDGMFMDGEQYACVSRNLANKKGTFWFPYLCDTWYLQNSIYFMEQPPLFYKLQSFSFLLFGNSMYSERIYSIFLMCLNMMAIHINWNLIVAEKLKKMSWLPIFLWIITPVCFWSIQNNIIELTLSFFTLLSCYMIIKGIHALRNKLLFFILGAILIFLATLTKGLQGLFPVTITVIYSLFNYKEFKFKKVLIYSSTVIAIPILLYVILITFNANAKESLTFYFYNRLLHRIESNPTTPHHFYILYLIIQELLPMFLFTVICILLKKRIKINSDLKTIKYANMYIAIGVCGSLPYILTLVQKSFYFLAAIPFFAIGFALINSEMILKLIEIMNAKKIVSKGFTIFSILFLICSLTFSFLKIGHVSRDEEMISDVKVLGNYLKKETSVDTDLEVYNTWNFQFYLLRKFNISIQPTRIGNKRKYYITTRNFYNHTYFGYKYISLPTQKYKLFEHID